MPLLGRDAVDDTRADAAEDLHDRPSAHQAKGKDGIGMHTPSEVHHGRHHAVRARREAALAAARVAHPERFATAGRLPKILDLPDQVWINKPEEQPQAEQQVA